MNLANEGFEARKKEEEVSAKKRKAEEDARWEGNVFYLGQHPTLTHLQQRTGNSEWTVGAASPIPRKRRRNRRELFLVEVPLGLNNRAMSVLVHIVFE